MVSFQHETVFTWYVETTITGYTQQTTITWYIGEPISTIDYEWIKPEKDPLKIKRNEVFDVNLQINCLNGDCGDVNVSLYYSQDNLCATQYFINENTGLKLESIGAGEGINPHSCGDMNQNEICYANFKLKGIRYGTYQLWAEIIAENAGITYTGCTERTILIPQPENVMLLILVTAKKQAVPLGLLIGGVALGGIMLWRRKKEKEAS